MSVEVISLALNLDPVPADRGGQPSSACKFVLVGLANHTRAGRNRRIPIGGQSNCQDLWIKIIRQLRAGPPRRAVRRVCR